MKKQTSDQWMKQVKDILSIELVNTDGWPQPITESYFMEEIDEVEFMARLENSEIRYLEKSR